MLYEVITYLYEGEGMAEKEKEKEIDKETQIPDNVPVLPVRDIVVFPYMIIPLSYNFV